ncbi:MAG: hypothetical protein HY701_12510 [Gemmatimonadetes bacterium]|nr:hypothetical protein [Gemmatimonadota bacterium]
MLDWIRDCEADGHRPRGGGIVVGSLIDPDRITNAHIRIHALEGRLFRSVLRDALDRSGVPYSIWRERDLYALAAGTLKKPERQIRDVLTRIGGTVDGTWRAEEKAAALAAWLVLIGDVSSAASTVRKARQECVIETTD